MEKERKEKIAYCGTLGSFSREAARRLFPNAELIPCESFEAAYRLTEKGDADHSVLPIENSYAGEVAPVIDLLYRGSLTLSEVRDMKVVQNLIGMKGASPADIRTVTSHPQALSQCAEYIAARRYAEIPSENTAFAAKFVAEKGDASLAAIASRECAEIYGLEVLEEDIATGESNATRFAVLGKKSAPARNGENFLLMFAVNDLSGALAAALKVLADHGYNLKALRSRPLKEKPWQYYFYVEAEGELRGDAKRALFADLEKLCATIKEVGHFLPEQHI
ncbi:MAG: bifunctional chorismate mutase/prephenate dehydratase [Clostridia bacterium]|nr:bifunctional chorismate mutase/prephenate dehydratase [Clostridia bacterium]